MISDRPGYAVSEGKCSESDSGPDLRKCRIMRRPGRGADARPDIIASRLWRDFASRHRRSADGSPTAPAASPRCRLPMLLAASRPQDLPASDRDLGIRMIIRLPISAALSRVAASSGGQPLYRVS